MKRLLFLAFIIVLGSCAKPKFVVTHKTLNDYEYNVGVAYVKPINKRAERTEVTTICINYDEYDVNDTIVVTRKKFTNY